MSEDLGQGFKSDGSRDIPQEDGSWLNVKIVNGKKVVTQISHPTAIECFWFRTNQCAHAHPSLCDQKHPQSRLPLLCPKPDIRAPVDQLCCVIPQTHPWGHDMTVCRVMSESPTGLLLVNNGRGAEEVFPISELEPYEVTMMNYIASKPSLASRTIIVGEGK